MVTKPPRCERCRMLVQGCLCALAPRLHTRTRLLVILSAAEAKKPTNTGRLAALCSDNSQVLVRGLPNQPLDLGFLAGQNAVVLCPDENATIVRRIAGPVTLVVPDGSWRQASKMPRREPMLRDLPRVMLPPLAALAPALRRETKDNGFATFVAVAHALGFIEDPLIEQAMLVFYDRIVQRIQSARQGQLS
ncbi:MAG: tRNA-uridine aminocarboxypropyltransferase [Polyangiaceae bacterium]